MKTKLFLYTLLLVFFTFSCKSQYSVSEFKVLEGTWKTENKETYELWKKDGNNSLIGKSYKLQDGQEKVTETLSIEEKNDKVIYKATVKNQNSGNTIAFTLNTAAKDIFSFENMEHDFPKKIQYKAVTNDKLLVNVLGENDKGFSYYLIRLK